MNKKIFLLFCSAVVVLMVNLAYAQERESVAPLLESSLPSDDLSHFSPIINQKDV